jgi:acyl carrier protein
MEEAAIYGILQEIFAEVFLRDDISLAASLSARDVAGWDSIKQIEIIMATEQRLGIRFTSKEIDDFHCLGDLVAAAARHVK